tara:strand:- start:2194 stop:2529 length:336 start_codon:yes stop_codon:yes gene_type:complete
MIESDWRKFLDRVRDKQTIPEDEVVLKEAIEAVYPGAGYVLTNIDPYNITFSDNREYDPVLILNKVKDLTFDVAKYRPTNAQLLEKLWKDIDEGKLNNTGSFYEALKPFVN